MSVDLIDIYRRIKKAADLGRGVRLSTEECFEMAYLDNAIEQAIWADDELKSERGNRDE